MERAGTRAVGKSLFMKWNRVVDKAKAIYNRYEEADISMGSAALAFHSILAIVPILGVVFWYLASIQLTDQWLTAARTWILAQLNVSSSVEFTQHFNRLTKAVHGYSWGWIGFAVLIYSAYNLIDKFGTSLDRILGSARPKGSKHDLYANFTFAVLLGRRMLVMLALPVALVISLSLSQWVRRDSWLHYLFDLKTFGPYFAMPLAWVSTIVSVFLVYLFVPKKHVPGREALKAALVVGPVMELVRYGFGLYNTFAVSTHKIYGVLAVIPLFVMWVQISWTVLLCGALLIRLPHRTRTVAKG